MSKIISALAVTGAVALAVALSFHLGGGREPLKIAYSDWPGWVAWEVAVQKGWFEDAGVDVEFVWFEYGPSMEAFAAARVDAVSMTNGDAMVLGAAGKKSTAVVINDFSNGNDMVIGRPGIRSVLDLKGRKIGVELNLVDHLLLLNALERNGMSESDVTLVNMPTNDTPQALAAGGVDAIAAWNPVAAQTLDQVAGSTPLFTSREAPGLIYDALYVDRTSLASRRGDWLKVASVWFRCVRFINDPTTQPEALAMMSARVGTTPERYQKFLAGTQLLGLSENLAAYREGDGLTSIVGSSRIVNRFNIENQVYSESQEVGSYFDSSLIQALHESREQAASGRKAAALAKRRGAEGA
jgi:NitT/TauT family transport system substrate-binding protein